MDIEVSETLKKLIMIIKKHIVKPLGRDVIVIIPKDAKKSK